MAEDKATEPIEIKEGIHSDGDFMAAIDKQMDAMKKPDKNKKKSLKEKESKEDTGEKIHVKTSSNRSAIKSEEKKEDKPFKKDDEKKIISRSGKTIQPVSITKSDKEIKTEAEDTDKGETVAVKVKPKEAPPKEEPKPEVEKSTTTTAPRENADDDKTPEQIASTESEASGDKVQVGYQEDDKKLKVEQSETAKKTEDTLQALKTFDTTKYHLPIKPTRHHRKHAVHPVTATLLLGIVVILIGVAAIDMEVLDVGVKLPFDVL